MSYEKPSKAEVNMILDAWFKLHQETKMLREALESIANSKCCGTCMEASLVARAALGNSGGSQPDSTGGGT